MMSMVCCANQMLPYLSKAIPNGSASASRTSYLSMVSSAGSYLATARPVCSVIQRPPPSDSSSKSRASGASSGRSGPITCVRLPSPGSTYPTVPVPVAVYHIMPPGPSASANGNESRPGT